MLNWTMLISGTSLIWLWWMLMELHWSEDVQSTLGLVHSEQGFCHEILFMGLQNLNWVEFCYGDFCLWDYKIWIGLNSVIRFWMLLQGRHSQPSFRGWICYETTKFVIGLQIICYMDKICCKDYKICYGLWGTTNILFVGTTKPRGDLNHSSCFVVITK